MILFSDIYAFGLIDRPPAGEPRPDPEQVEIAKDWLDRYATKATTYPPYITSYTLKHRCERSLSPFKSISNGAVIRALVDCGYTVRRTTPTSPNVDVKIKFRKEA